MNFINQKVWWIIGGGLVALMGCTSLSKDRSAELLLAAAANDIQTVQSLIQNGTSVNAANLNGTTALMVAAFRDHRDMIELLLEKGALVDQPDKDGQTALHQAVVHSKLAAVALLVQAQASPNIVDTLGVTSLMAAAAKPSGATMIKLLISAIWQMEKKTVRNLKATHKYLMINLVLSTILAY